MDLRHLLAHPSIYTLFQNIMGASEGRKRFATQYICSKPGDVVLDIGCGPADLLTHMPSVDYWGYDIDEGYVRSARLKSNKPDQIKCKLFQESDLEELPAVNIVILSGVFHHLSDSEIRELLALVIQSLAPNGKLVSVDPCICDNQNLIARYLIGKDRGNYVRTEHAYRNLLLPHFTSVSSSLRHQRWVPYTHCYMSCSKPY